jgi:hypothetical protein
MLGHDYGSTVIKAVRSHMGIVLSYDKAVCYWQLPEHLQQVVLDTDREAAAALIEAAGSDLDEWQLLWDGRTAGREWLVARALAERNAKAL